MANPWGEDDMASRVGGSAAKPSTLDRTKEVASAGVEKSKAVAAVGYEKTKVAAKKVKEGASVGVNWLKVKYNKSKLFQKK